MLKISLVLYLLPLVLAYDDYEPKQVDFDALVQKINAGKGGKGSSWKAGRNPRVEKELFEMEKIGGFPWPGGEDEEEPAEHEPEEASTYDSMPLSFDSRDKWPHCKDVIGHVRDQGRCESSWALQAGAVLSDRLCIVSNGSIKVHLSVEDIMGCCTNYCLHDPYNVCRGGYAIKAYEYMHHVGAVTEGCKPYTRHSYHGRFSIPCTRQCDTYYGKPYINDRYHAKTFYTLHPNYNRTALQNEIYNYGPVTAWIKVYQDLTEYQDGIYQHRWGVFRFMQHVKIIGWGQAASILYRRRYWLCVNSWGRDWGRLGGLFKVYRLINGIGLEKTITAARAFPYVSEHMRKMSVPNSGHSWKPSACVVLILILWHDSL